MRDPLEETEDWYRNTALKHIYFETISFLRNKGVMLGDAELNFDGEFPHFDPYWNCPDLISAMVLQFYWFLINPPNLVRCVDCHQYFEREKGSNAIRCKECRPGGRQKAYYKRMKKIKKLIKEGKSIDEIHERVPRSKRETIKKRMEEMNS